MLGECFHYAEHMRWDPGSKPFMSRYFINQNEMAGAEEQRKKICVIASNAAFGK